LTAFLRAYPDTAWRGVARAAIGRAYEQMGEMERARQAYVEASVDPYVGAASRLAERGATE
jgi:hypothetical protein